MKLGVLGLAVVGLALAGGAAHAADFDMANATVASTEAVPPGGWTVAITPYGWMTSINGTITAKGRSVSTDMSFIDLLKDSDKLVPFMGAFEVSKDRFHIFGDLFYSDVGFAGDKSFQLNPVKGLEIDGDAKAAAEVELTIIQAAAAYDVIKQGGTSVAAYAGLRYWSVESEIDLKVTGSVDVQALGLKRKGKYAVARSGTVDWVDPLVGMRVKQELTPRDRIELAADIGGFGVGSAFSWQVFGGYTHDWDIGRATKLALTLGYRILSVDYEEGSGTSKRGLDLALHGPMAGLTLRW